MVSYELFVPPPSPLQKNTPAWPSWFLDSARLSYSKRLSLLDALAAKVAAAKALPPGEFGQAVLCIVDFTFVDKRLSGEAYRQQEGARLRLALAQRCPRLIPSLCRRVAGAGLPPEEDPASAEADVVALTLLGVLHESIGGGCLADDVADAVLGPAAPFLSDQPSWRRFLALVAAPAAAADPNWPAGLSQADGEHRHVPYSSRPAMVVSCIPSLLWGSKEAREAFKQAGGYALLDIAGRPDE
ncbi:hypothetical protein ABPG75_006612 [Micractinium tetrahymenae]